MEYDVEAVRDQRWTTYRVPSLGLVGQVRIQTDTAEAARNLIAATLNIPADTVTVRLRFPQADQARALLAEADRHKDAARAEWEQSARLRSQAVTTLRDTGWTYQDIADALGLSYRRVYVLAHGGTDTEQED